MLRSHSFNFLIFAICTSIFGCASPKLINNNYSKKVINFPSLNSVNTVNTGEILYLNYDYESTFTYKFEDEVNMFVLLHKVTVPKGTLIGKSIWKGKEAFCYRNSYQEYCFEDTTQGGAFNKVSVQGGLVWPSKDLSPPIKYSKIEKFKPKSLPAKIELLFDGYENGIASFIYKEFTDSSEQPSVNNPVSVDIKTLPQLVNIKNIPLEIKKIDKSSLTYVIGK